MQFSIWLVDWSKTFEMTLHVNFALKILVQLTEILDSQIYLVHYFLQCSSVWVILRIQEVLNILNPLKTVKHNCESFENSKKFWSIKFRNTKSYYPEMTSDGRGQPNLIFSCRRTARAAIEVGFPGLKRGCYSHHQCRSEVPNIGWAHS